MKKLILLFILLINISVFAQNDFDFFKGFDVNLNTFSYNKLLLSDDTFLVPIPFNKSAYYLDNNIVVNNPHFVPQAGIKNTKLLFARYNANGQLLNYFTLNSSGYEILKDIRIDHNDDLYLVYEVDVGYQLNGNTYFANSIHPESKNMIVKIGNIKNMVGNQTPNVIWVKTLLANITYINLHITKNNEVYFIAPTTQKGILVDDMIYPNNSAHPQNSLQRVIVGKLNLNSNGLEWLTTSTNDLKEKFSHLNVFGWGLILRSDSKNNLYIVGNTMGGKAKFGNTTIEHDLGSNNQKIFMVKLNSSGNVIWAKSPSLKLNKGLILRAINFEIDEHDNLYLLEQYLGVSPSQSMVDYWGASYTLNRNNSTLLKLDSNAQVIWIKQPTIDIGYNTLFMLEGFKIVNTKILVFGYFKGRLDYGNGIKLQSDNDFKWLSLEINRDTKDIDNYYVLDTSLPIMPFHLLGIDKSNSLWFSSITATNGNSQAYIGSLNYHFTGVSGTQTLIYFRSRPVLLNNEKLTYLNLSIFPNPTKNKLYLNGENLVDVNYHIYDLSGKLINFGKIENNEINVETISNGTYLLKVYDRNDTRKNKSIKFIKQ